MSSRTTTTKTQSTPASGSSTLRQPSKIAIPTPFLNASNAPKNPSSKEVKDSTEKDKTLNRTKSTVGVKTSATTPSPPENPPPTTNATTSKQQPDPPLTAAEEKKENRRSIRLFGTLPRSYKNTTKATTPSDSNASQAQSNGNTTATTTKSSSKSSKGADTNNNTNAKSSESSKAQSPSEQKESTHTSVFSDIKRALTKNPTPSSHEPQQEKQDKVLVETVTDSPKTKASRSSTLEDVMDGPDSDAATPKSRRKTKKEKKEREAMQSQLTELKDLVEKLSTKVTELNTTIETEVSRRKMLEESYVKLKVSFEQFKLEQYNKSSGNLGTVKLNAMSNQNEEQQYNTWARKYSVESSASESSKGGTIGKKGLRNSLGLSLKRSATPEKEKKEDKDSSSVRIDMSASDNESPSSSRSATLDSKNMSLEAVAKADLIKEQLGNKYSSFASLRRRQIEQLEGRKRAPGSPQMDSRRRSMSLDGTARLPSDSSSDELLKSELRRSKEYIEVSKLLTNRSAKNVLVQKGILSNNLFGVPLESVQVEHDVPVFVINSLAFIESKLDEYTIEEIFESTFPQETIDAARRNVESGNIEFSGGSRLNLNQNQNSITDPRVVAELLKLFFKRLPDALIPFKGYKYFIQWNEIDDNDEYKCNTMRSLIYFVPASNRALLHYFTNFIYRVCIYNDITDAEKIDHERSSVNPAQPHFMNTLSTLAKVFGPLILRAPTMSMKSEDYLKQLEKQLSATANKGQQSPQPEPKFGFAEERAGENLLRFLVMNHAVFQDEPDVQYAMQQGKRLVSACSVPKIFVKLMDEYYNESDPHFTEVVLLTHMYHVKADNLLDFLAQHCKSTDQPWKHRLRSRAMRLLKQWLGGYSSLLKADKGFVEKFKAFFESNQSIKEETVFTKFLQYVNDGESDNAGADTPTIGREFPYDSVDLMEIANHIHLLDYECLGGIRSQEFLDKAFSYPERSPNFHKMADQWNKRTLWVVTEILKRDKPRNRANCIDFFIKISHILRNLNDFHSSYAIIVALNHNTISRLKKSWSKLSKKAMAMYQNLLELFDMSYNFRSYRAALSSAHGSYAVIPYIGLLPKDLTSLEEIPNKTEEGLINFGKMRKLWSAIGQIRQYQMNNKYIIAVEQINNELYEALKNPKVFSDKEMREISELHEPSQRRTPVDSPAKAPLITVSSGSSASPNTSNSSLLSQGSTAAKHRSVRGANIDVGLQPKGILQNSIDKSDTDHSIHTHELNDVAMSTYRDRDSYNSYNNEDNDNYATTIELSEAETSEMEEPTSSRIKKVNFEISSVKEDDDTYVAEDMTDDFSSSDDDEDMAELSALSSRLPPAAANALTEISRISFSPDSIPQYPIPSPSKTFSPPHSPYGKPPMTRENGLSPSSITRQRSISMSAKDKADVIKDMFSNKYGNIATYRKGQLQQLTLGRKGRNQVLKRGRLDDAFWEIKEKSQSDQSSDDDEFDSHNF